MKNQKIILIISSIFLVGNIFCQNVGINKTNPSTALDVSGTTTIVRSSSSANPQLDLKDLGDGYSRLKFTRDTSISSNYWILSGRTFEGNDASSRFNLYYKGDNGGSDLISVKGDGKVGLGVVPSDRFHVSSGSGENALRVQIGGSTKMRIFENGSVSIGSNNENVSPGDVYIHTNLGIGISQPTQKLDVNGNINFSGNLYKNNVLYNPATSLNELSDAKTGGNSVFVGANAGISDDNSSNKNVALGDYALHDNTSGYENVAIGMSTSYNNNGNNNVVVGYQADYYNQSGWNNTIIGHKAGGGTANHTKTGNVFIGALAGYYETGSNKLYIHNNNTTIPLIWGDFTSGLEKIKINGEFEVQNTKTAKIHKLQVPIQTKLLS